jgi:hypothetical protein
MHLNFFSDKLRNIVVQHVAGVGQNFERDVLKRCEA